MRKLVINQCPTHGWWAVTVDNDGGGVRVTPSKCCGRWDEVKSFALTAAQWLELARIAEEAAEEADVPRAARHAGPPAGEQGAGGPSDEAALNAIVGELNGAGYDCGIAHAAEAVREVVQARNAAELALRNCLLMAMRQVAYKSRQTPETQELSWRHVVRFCKSAGVEPTLRRASAVTDAPVSQGAAVNTDERGASVLCALDIDVTPQMRRRWEYRVAPDGLVEARRQHGDADSFMGEWEVVGAVEGGLARALAAEQQARQAREALWLGYVQLLDTLWRVHAGDVDPPASWYVGGVDPLIERLRAALGLDDQNRPLDQGGQTRAAGRAKGDAT